MALTGRAWSRRCPRPIIGRPDTGVIAVGAPADLVLFRARSWTELLARRNPTASCCAPAWPIDTTLPDYRELDDLMRCRMDLTDIPRRTALGDIPIEDNPAIVKQKSRDFFWYSPVLKRELDHVTADLVVSPKNEAEVIPILATCHAAGVPVTPRGSGTGNYGQAMPLAGGVILNLAEMNALKSMAVGRVVAEAGAILAQIDREPGRVPPGDPPPSLDLQHRLDRRLHRRRLGRRRLDQLGRPARPRQRAPASASSPWRRARASSS